MSDLIRRNRAISILEQLEEHSLSGKMHISNAIYLLENQPTAYDIDKVVDELKELKAYAVYEDINADTKWLDKAIEIVKQGGVSDDVCEWKLANDGEFIQNPHTRRTFSNEPSMQNVYCNTCGKKIKVVD